MLTVYERDNCQSCLFTKRYLTKYGVPFETKPIDDEVLAQAREHGYYEAPVVVPDGDWSRSWSGASPERIREYANALDTGV